MPKAREHMLINAVAIGAIDTAVQLQALERDPGRKFDFLRLLGMIAVGVAAGAVPDFLEPSLGNPNHRGFCHSLSAAVLVWWIVGGSHTTNVPASVKRILNAFAGGYSLHLAADLGLSAGKGMGLVCAKF